MEMKAIRQLFRLRILVSVASFSIGSAHADLTGVPFYVDIERTATATTACLLVERLPIAELDVAGLARSTEPGPRALARTLTLLASGQVDAVQAESVQAAGRSNVPLASQIQMYAQQLRGMSVGKLKHAFALGDHQVFYVEFVGKAQSQRLTAPLTFVRTGQDFRFQPERPQTSAFALLDYAIRGAEKLGAAASQGRCQDGNWQSLQHRLPLVAEDASGPNQAALAFAGIEVNNSAPSQLQREIDQVLDGLRQAGAADRFDALAGLMSSESWVRIRSAAATPDAIALLAEIKSYRLGYVLDLGDVAFAYVQARDGALRVLCFHRSQNRWVWVNVNRVHYTSNFLGAARQLSLAREKPPFSSVKGGPRPR